MTDACPEVTADDPSGVAAPVDEVATNVTLPSVAELTVAVTLNESVVRAVGAVEVTDVVVAAPPLMVKSRHQPPTVDDPLPVLL